MQRHYLNAVFEPRSVAIIGANSEADTAGGLILHNLRREPYTGALFPILAEGVTIHDLPCYGAIGEVEQAIDLAVITLPSEQVPAAVTQCADNHVRAIAVISAGFAEIGQRGERLQREVVEIARSHAIPLLGPDCLGVIRPRIGLHACYSRSRVNNGQVALVAQSSAFCSALLDWASSAGFGFSTVISLGACAGVSLGEVLDFLALDPQTDSILLYSEGISDARAFISGLRVASRIKPVIVVKAGRSGSRAEVCHAGIDRGSDAVFDAAINRAGAVRVNTVNELFAAAMTLASKVRTRGSRLAILTNGAGPGMMAADRAVDRQLTLARLAPETVEKLRTLLPGHWSPSMPLDLLADAGPERYRQAVEIVLADAGVDGVLVMLAPLAMTDPEACAQAVVAASASSHKPLLSCWMGDQLIRRGRAILEEAGLRDFRSPEAGVDAFAVLAAYRRSQTELLQAPAPVSKQAQPDVQGARLIIQHVLNEQRGPLTVTEAKAVLRAFRIPVSTSINANAASEALIAAQNLGLPVAMKVNSPDIRNKSDVGGVRLNIREALSVRTAFNEILAAVEASCPDARIEGISVESMVDKPHAREIRVGIGRDPVFGPVISLGVGGTSVDAFADNQLALPPLNNYLADKLIRRTRAAQLLGPLRNMPAADYSALVEVLRRVSEMACELPEIVELDINPLLVDELGIIAVDARIVVAPPQSSTAHYGHMAIHPYPRELESLWQLDDGASIRIRPIRPEDAVIEQDFVANLSAESRYFRFMNQMEKLSPQMLARFTQIDYDREMALVATLGEPGSDEQILGVARYISYPDFRSCEFALAVADDWQKQGVGRELMLQLMTIARDRGLQIMEGEVLAQNRKMLKFCKRLGFDGSRDPEDPDIVQVKRHL